MDQYSENLYKLMCDGYEKVSKRITNICLITVLEINVTIVYMGIMEFGR